LPSEQIEFNVIPIIKALLPKRHKKSKPIYIIIVFSITEAKKRHINLEQLLELYRELLKNEKQIRISLYPISGSKLHDRHIYTENIIIELSSSIDFMSHKGALIENLYKSYSLDVYGIGCGRKFENLEIKFQALKKEIVSLNETNSCIGDPAF